MQYNHQQQSVIAVLLKCAVQILTPVNQFVAITGVNLVWYRQEILENVNLLKDMLSMLFID